MKTVGFRLTLVIAQLLEAARVHDIVEVVAVGVTAMLLPPARVNEPNDAVPVHSAGGAAGDVVKVVDATLSTITAPLLSVVWLTLGAALVPEFEARLSRGVLWSTPSKDVAPAATMDRRLGVTTTEFAPVAGVNMPQISERTVPFVCAVINARLLPA